MCGKYVWRIVIIAALLCGACSLEGGDGLGTTTRPDGKTYTVSFNANGGSGSVPVPQSAESGTYITLPNEGGLSRSGYVFGGWSALSSGSGTKFASGSSYTVPNQDSVLYAFWNNNRESYTVSFDTNGGSGAAPGSQTVQAGSTLALSGGDGMSISGYTFTGWTSNASDGAVYRPGDTFTPTRNSVFFANWESAASVYTVTFNANGGNGTAPALQTATAGSSITLPSGNVLSRSGYGFSGWNTNTAGTGSNYNAGERYTPAGNATLYAKWDVALPDHTVTFSANGGTGTAPTAQKAKAGSSITLPNGNNLSRSGYTFGGWNTNASGSGTNYNAGDSFAVSGNTTLYAKWNTATANYTVTFNANGGSGTVPASQTAKAGSSITLPNGNSLSRSGYIFGGWNTNAAGTGSNHNAGASYTVNGNVTLYAKWNVTGTSSPSGGSNVFTSVAALTAHLKTLPANTIDTPYTVALNVNPLPKMDDNNFSYKYVGLDLSNSAITSIGDSTVAYCKSLINIIIPSSVTSIGQRAFIICANLAKITIPNSVTSIGNGAFSVCTNLTSITIPSSVTSIGQQAFNNCTSLTSITIPNSVTSIGEKAFWCCTSLTSISIPSSVTSIELYAFYNCSSLFMVTFEGYVTSFDSNAFFQTGDYLKSAHRAGGPGTYTRTSGVSV